MKTNAYKRPLRALYVLLALFLFLLGVGLFFAVAEVQSSRTARVLPSYEKTDIVEILRTSPTEWSDEQIFELSRQTGILSAGELERIATSDPAKLLDFQDALYFEGDIEREPIVEGITYHDQLCFPGTKKFFHAPIVDLQPGDVILTSSTHTLGWRHGHASLILSGNQMLQSVAIGVPSQMLSRENVAAGIPWYRRSPNFIILRLKDTTEEQRKEVAAYASAHLVGVPYSLTVGIFSKKDQGENPKVTQCAHLVWQAFKRFGYDIDADGGPVVTPRDISMCEDFDVVQVYGFDIDKLW